MFQEGGALEGMFVLYLHVWSVPHDSPLLSVCGLRIARSASVSGHVEALFNAAVEDFVSLSGIPRSVRMISLVATADSQEILDQIQ